MRALACILLLACSLPVAAQTADSAETIARPTTVEDVLAVVRQDETRIAQLEARLMALEHPKHRRHKRR